MNACMYLQSEGKNQEFLTTSMLPPIIYHPFLSTDFATYFQTQGEADWREWLLFYFIATFRDYVRLTLASVVIFKIY